LFLVWSVNGTLEKKYMLWWFRILFLAVGVRRRDTFV
jgi:hypothetical protein